MHPLFFNSLEPNAQVSFLIKICSLFVIVVVVNVVVVVIVVNYEHFRLLLQNHWANLNQTLHKAFLGKGNSRMLK